MFILLNGSFGIGKTTTAELLQRDLSGSVIYDPEDIGWWLRRLPPWLIGLRRQPDDYQDMRLWRTLMTRGTLAAHRRASPVIVPMAFTNLDYFDAYAEMLEAAAPVARICLVAPLEVIRARLAERATREGRQISAFEFRRSAECADAHRDPAFGTPVDALGAPAEVVRRIREVIGT